MTSARLYMFRGSEADNDHCPVPFFEPSLDPEPMSDDKREAQAAFEDCPTTRRYSRTLHGIEGAYRKDPEYADPFALSFAMQDVERRELIWKWVDRFTYALGAGLLVWLALGR